MSSAGINAINSGPLNIRTYKNGAKKTFVLTDYDIPVTSGSILITSAGGELVPSTTLSALKVGNINTDILQLSTLRDRDGLTGSNGEVLHTNGSTIYWAPSGAGTGYWSENGSVIFNNNGGNVGINTITPQYALDVNGSLNVNSYISSGIINMSQGQITGLSTINGLAWPPTDDALWSKSGSNIYNDNPGGNVGINTTTPQFTLDVAGSIKTSTYVSTNTINMNNGAINFNSVLNIDSYQSNTNNGIINIGTTYNPIIYLGSNGSNQTHAVNGNLSISNNTTVSGSLLTNTIANVNQLTFNNNQGQITGLSTINGLAWPPSDDALWSKSTTNPNNIYNDNPGNVGIGTSSPPNPLYVSTLSAVTPTTITYNYTSNPVNVPIPPGTDHITFQMIGAGGSNRFEANMGAGSGWGAYISGTLNVISGDSLQLYIGECNETTGTSGGSAIILTRGTTTIAAIAGAGGGAGNSNGDGQNSAGGHGGGANGSVNNGNSGGFTNGIAPGIQGTDDTNAVAFAGLGGTNIGGTGSGGGGTTPNQNGAANGQNPSPTFIPVNGGVGGILGSGNQGGYGGGGYAGGGGGGAANNTSSGDNVSAGGGGGSTYIDFNNIQNVISYSGSNYLSLPSPPINTYGSPKNNGQIIITFYPSNITAIGTDGNISCADISCNKLNINSGFILGCAGIFGNLVKSEFWNWVGTGGVAVQTPASYVIIGDLLVRWCNLNGTTVGSLGYSCTYDGPAFSNSTYYIGGTVLNGGSGDIFNVYSYTTNGFTILNSSNNSFIIICVGQAA